MLRIIITILLIFSTNIIFGQTIITRAVIIRGDTIPHVMLKEVVVKGKFRGNGFYRRYHNRQTRLEYNVRKVFPFARLAAQKINEIESKIAKLPKKSDRNAVIKQEYAQLMKTFKAPLTKLSINQGRILIRLVYRETNNTTFAHIRDYKGGFTAYFWQSVALIFGNNLKSQYNPYGEDKDIEEIVLKIQKEEKGGD